MEFLRWLRPEKKFPDAGALRAQIMRDIQRAQVYFRRFRHLVKAAAG
ncbi:MAG: riboflavin kinase [Bryobacteraceae bacterium]